MESRLASAADLKQRSRPAVRYDAITGLAANRRPVDGHARPGCHETTGPRSRSALSDDWSRGTRELAVAGESDSKRMPGDVNVTAEKSAGAYAEHGVRGIGESRRARETTVCRRGGQVGPVADKSCHSQHPGPRPVGTESWSRCGSRLYGCARRCFGRLPPWCAPRPRSGWHLSWHRSCGERRL